MKKLLSTLLCLALVLSLASAALAEDVGLAKYDEPVTVTFVRSVDDTMETNILSVLDGATVEDNLWIDAYLDKLNIKVEYEWIVNQSEYEQKLNLAIASGDIPDLLRVNATQLQQLAEAEMIIPVGEIYEQYATDFTKATLVEETETVFNAAYYDSKLYGLPETGCSSDSTSFLWIRNDWLDKLDMAVPTTMEDVLAVAEAFVTKDPDGNGADDTYGIVFGKSLWDDWCELEGFFNGYGAYPNIWVKNEEGKLVYGSVQSEVKDALAALADLYKKGYIDPEFCVKDGGAAAELAVSGKVGMFYGPQWVPLYPLQTNKDNDPNAVWTGYAPVALAGKELKAQNPVATSNYWVVSKECEHPEALVKMYNLFIELCWGETGDNGVYYAPMDCEGIWKLSPLSPSKPYKNIDAFRALDKERKTGDASDVVGEAASIKLKIDTYFSGSDEGHALWGWERIYGAEGVYGRMVELSEADAFLVDEFSGASTPTMIERMSTLDDLQDETFTKIIMGEVGIEEFDAWVKNFESLGGAQITEEVNEWFAALQ